MRLHSLSFAGYRSFAARSPAERNRPLERLDLAPLTVLLGKNNSGKSTAARLVHHVLLALGSDGKDPFPMAGESRRYGARFRDVLYNNEFFRPLDLHVEMRDEDGKPSVLDVRLIQSSDGADDRLPVIQSMTFEGRAVDIEHHPARGLLPALVEAQRWREGSRALLEASCHLGPVRDDVADVYDVTRDHPGPWLPSEGNVVAQMLLADAELRAAVGAWMAEHLEGWRVDVRQTLDTFKLVVRRGGREANLASAGQGIQQVLPVVALCFARELGRLPTPFLDVVEQPELHLHDAAHAPLGDLLLSAIASGMGNLIVETHSEALVLRIRRRVAEGVLRPDQVSLIFVEDEGQGSRLRLIPLKGDGEVDWWPAGVFSESFEEVKAIRRAQRARGGA